MAVTSAADQKPRDSWSLYLSCSYFTSNLGVCVMAICQSLISCDCFDYVINVLLELLCPDVASRLWSLFSQWSAFSFGGALWNAQSLCQIYIRSSFFVILFDVFFVLLHLTFPFFWDIFSISGTTSFSAPNCADIDVDRKRSDTFRCFLPLWHLRLFLCLSSSSFFFFSTYGCLCPWVPLCNPAFLLSSHPYFFIFIFSFLLPVLDPFVLFFRIVKCWNLRLILSTSWNLKL